MDAQANVSNSNSNALAAATDTTLSLKENVGIDAVVLDVEVAQSQAAAEVLRVDKRGEACRHVQGAVSFDGQKIVIAPHGVGPSGDALAADRLGDAGVVVLDLQRAKAEVTRVEGFDRVLPVAPAGSADSLRGTSTQSSIACRCPLHAGAAVKAQRDDGSEARGNRRQPASLQEGI